MSAKDTVDKNDLAHFEKILWWAETAPLKALHAMNRLRVPFVQESLMRNHLIKDDLINSATPLLGLKIADVGCGGGFLSEPLARLGAQVTGIDISGAALKQARSHAALDASLGSRLNYIETSIEEHAETHKGVYDAIVSSEVIEHVSNKAIYTKACYEVLKSGGSFILTTISKSFMAWLIAIYLFERVLNIIPSGTHQYDKLISSQELKDLLKQHNCTTLDVRGMLYYPFYNQWEWTPFFEIFYAIHAVKDI